QVLQLRHEAPVAADDLPYQPSVREMIESPLVAIALPGRVDQRKTAWMAWRRGFHVARAEETLLDCDRDLLREADADEAAARQRAAVTDELHRVRRRDDLSLLVALEKRQGGMLDHVVSEPFRPA